MEKEMKPPRQTMMGWLKECLLDWYWRLRKPVFVIVMGGPGAGKGTVASKAAPITGLAHISTGDLLRREVNNRTEIGKYAEALMKNGEFVSDEITLYLLRKELTKFKNRRGAIIDGYPRSEVQAQLLEQLLYDWNIDIPLVVMIEVSEEDLVERLGGRLTCTNKECGATFHVKFNPPKEEGICDVCGSELYRREDDNPETIPNRLEAYKTKTAPLLRFYRLNDKLAVIQSTNETGSEKVLEEFLAAVEKESTN